MLRKCGACFLMYQPAFHHCTQAGRWDDANAVKRKLEEAQRARRRSMESSREVWEPAWFAKQMDPIETGREIHVYKGGYWEAKASQTWPQAVDIFEVAA